MDKKEFLSIKNEKMHYCNSPIRADKRLEVDMFLVPEGFWKYLHAIYKGEEIKRFAVYKNQAGVIDRSPNLPMVRNY